MILFAECTAKMSKLIFFISYNKLMNKFKAWNFYKGSMESSTSNDAILWFSIYNLLVFDA